MSCNNFFRAQKNILVELEPTYAVYRKVSATLSPPLNVADQLGGHIVKLLDLAGYMRISVDRSAAARGNA